MDRLAIETDEDDHLVVSSHPSLKQSRRGSSLFAGLLVAITLGGLAALAYVTFLAVGPSQAGSLGALSIYGPILFTVGGLAVAAFRAAPRFRRLTIDGDTWRLETLAVRRFAGDPEVIEEREFAAAEAVATVEEDDRGRPYLELRRGERQVGTMGDIAASRLAEPSALETFRDELDALQGRIQSH
jgi:hypothetical protein